MRRAPISQAVAEEEEINITPMLDVVFILLFSLLSQQTLLKSLVSKLTDQTQKQQSLRKCCNFNAVGNAGEIYMDGRRIDKRQVKANVVRLLAENPQGSVVIQADEKATADTIMAVMDGAREAGVYNISLASEPQF